VGQFGWGKCVYSTEHVDFKSDAWVWHGYCFGGVGMDCCGGEKYTHMHVSCIIRDSFRFS